MEAIAFRTPGLIDLRAFTVMGFNAKPTKPNPIGFFGTGLKYAVAVITRLGGTMEVYIGRDKYVFFAKKVDFRGKEFEQVWMRSEKWKMRARNTELPFTTEYGKNWEPWMAFRELESNTRDEDGETFVSGLPLSDIVEGETQIVVSGLPGFIEAYHNRETIFLDRDNRPVIAEDYGVTVRQGSNKLLYYQGLRAKEVPKPTLYTYDFKSTLGLTEDRTFAHDWHVRQNLAQFVTQSDDEQLIKAIVTADEDHWEHGLEFPAHYKPSDAFRRVMASRPRGVSGSARSYYGRHDRSSYIERRSPWHTSPHPWRLEDDNITDADGKALFSVPHDYDFGNWDYLARDFLRFVGERGVDTGTLLFEWNGPKICSLCKEPSITNLDGDELCQEHANQWVRSEGIIAFEDADPF